MATASAASVGRRHGPVDEAVAWILNVHKIGESDPAAAAAPGAMANKLCPDTPPTFVSFLYS